MIGLVLVTHGQLAAEFITAMEHVVGPQQAIEGICIDAEDDMEMRRKEIADAIQRCDQGDGVIILTDLFGGTPSNLAISLMKSENVEVIAGVNLPMLIRLEGARKAMSVRAAVAAAREAGRLGGPTERRADRGRKAASLLHRGCRAERRHGLVRAPLAHRDGDTLHRPTRVPGPGRLRDMRRRPRLRLLKRGGREPRARAQRSRRPMRLGSR